MDASCWMENDMTFRVAINMGGDPHRGPSTRWIVASCNLGVGDWAAYEGTGTDPQEVARHGDKMDPADVRIGFLAPFATGFKWRP